jgi:GAF domain-containing protein
MPRSYYLESLLSIARDFALESDPAHIAWRLLREAVGACNADGGAVLRWDETRQVLVLGWNAAVGLAYDVEISIGQSAAGQAAAWRAPVAIHDYQTSPFAVPQFVAQGVQAALAAPLLHERHLLAVVEVFSSRPRRQFSARNTETLELQAGLAAAALIGAERARLEGVLLAARTAEHELNNQLTLTVGYSELLENDPRLPQALRAYTTEVVQSARGAADALRALRQVTRIEEQDFGPPVGTTLDLRRATDPSREPLP